MNTELIQRLTIALDWLEDLIQGQMVESTTPDGTEYYKNHLRASSSTQLLRSSTMNEFHEDCEGYGGSPEWIKNTGIRPKDYALVDVKLNGDLEDVPGIPMIRFGVDPSNWDWAVDAFDACAIAYWRPAA